MVYSVHADQHRETTNYPVSFIYNERRFYVRIGDNSPNLGLSPKYDSPP